MHYQRQISIQLHHHVNSIQCSTLSDDSKQYSATATAHIKLLILLLKDKKILTTSLSTILRNTGGCAKQYRCASVLYLMSVMYQCYPIITYRGISAPGHGKDIVYGLNAVDKRYIRGSTPRF